MACLEGESHEKFIKDYISMYLKSQNMDESQGGRPGLSILIYFQFE